jgi:putative heme transporter
MGNPRSVLDSVVGAVTSANVPGRPAGSTVDPSLVDHPADGANPACRVERDQEGGGVGTLDQVGANLRRAYEAGRESVRAARAEARAFAAADEDLESQEMMVLVSPGDQDRIEFGLQPTDVPRSLRIAAAWAWRLIALAAALAGVVWLVGELQLVVVPLAIALLLTALLSPMVGWLRRRRAPRSLATVIVMITGMAAVAGTLTMVINAVIAGFPNLSNKSGEGLHKIQQWLRTGPLHLTDKQINSFLDQLQSWLQSNQGTLTSGALSTANTLSHVLAGLLLVLFATFFFLRDGRRIARFVVGLLPEPYREDVASAADMSWGTLVSYVRATVLVAFIDAVGIGLALVILRIDLAFPLAALVFLGAFVPIVGAALSGAVAVLVALVTQGPVIALLVLGAVIAVQQLEGHVLQPLIMGRAVAIHPLAVIVAIATGVVVGGIIGALVAVPVVAVLNTAVRHLAERRRSEDLGEPPPGPPAPTGPPEPGAPGALEPAP